MLFEPNITFAQRRLDAFVSLNAREYAEKRNFDLGQGKHSAVSLLSPYLRRKVIKECEVIEAVLKKNDQATVEKFIDEVLWRTYWKGWLEMRPQIWSDYLDSLKRLALRLESEENLLQRYTLASKGMSGIECFDYWVKELLETGYLHNHSRMWFASIWIFTLNLPWELGADFFYKNLFDADPASNTLSWRWVAGLHTKGKHYLAAESNILKFTQNRFSAPIALAKSPGPIVENYFSHPECQELKKLPSSFPLNNFCLLITEENLRPSLQDSKPKVIIALSTLSSHKLYRQNSKVQRFGEDLLINLAREKSEEIGVPFFVIESSNELADIASSLECYQVYSAFCPVGPVSSLLAQFREDLKGSKIALIEVIDTWEKQLYPYAKKGFFDFRKSSKEVVEGLRN